MNSFELTDTCSWSQIVLESWEWASLVSANCLKLDRSMVRCVLIIFLLFLSQKYSTLSLIRTVADNLRTTKNTSEMFDSATVCFTEIDGWRSWLLPRQMLSTDIVKVQDNCQELHAASALWSSQHSIQNFWCEVLHDTFSQLPRLLYSGLRATTCTRWRPSTTAIWWPVGWPRGTGPGTPRRLPTCVWSSCSSRPVSEGLIVAQSRLNRVNNI